MPRGRKADGVRKYVGAPARRLRRHHCGSVFESAPREGIERLAVLHDTHRLVRALPGARTNASRGRILRQVRGAAPRTLNRKSGLSESLQSGRDRGPIILAVVGIGHPIVLVQTENGPLETVRATHAGCATWDHLSQRALGAPFSARREGVGARKKRWLPE